MDVELGTRSSDQISGEILDELSPTPFACSSLQLLPSGTTNFAFRGILEKPYTLPFEGTSQNNARQPRVTTIMVKRIEGFARVAPALRIDSGRGPFESFMLGALGSFQWNNKQISTVGSSIRAEEDVRTPRLLHVNSSKNTLVTEDFGPETVNMEEHICTTGISEEIIRRNCVNLGAWLRAFHLWATEPAQSRVRDRARGNKKMGDFKRDITYGLMSKWCEEVGLLDDETRAIFLEVNELAAREYADDDSMHESKEWGPIHSDFWTGNVLFPPHGGHNGQPSISVIDWEFAHLAPHAYDLGNIIGDLVEKGKLNKLHPFGHAINGFVEGYGGISQSMAFRALVHAGVHLMGWYVRGPKSGLNKEEIRNIFKFGRDMVCYGMKREEQWFQSNGLGLIFEQKEQRPN